MSAADRQIPYVAIDINDAQTLLYEARTWTEYIVQAESYLGKTNPEAAAAWERVNDAVDAVLKADNADHETGSA